MPQTRSNRILLWMCVLITVNQLGFGGIIPALALYARSFGVAQSAIGVTIAIYGLARFLVAMPAGQLADRVGRRPALAIGGRATAAGNSSLRVRAELRRARGRSIPGGHRSGT